MSREMTISPAEVAERRMDAWVMTAAVEPLEADWVSIRFELKRLRKENEEMRAMLIEHGLTHMAAGVMPNAM